MNPEHRRTNETKPNTNLVWFLLLLVATIAVCVGVIFQPTSYSLNYLDFGRLVKATKYIDRNLSPDSKYEGYIDLDIRGSKPYRVRYSGLRDVLIEDRTIKVKAFHEVVGAPGSKKLADFLADTQLSDCATPGFGRNDLQAVAQLQCAEVGQAARWLQARFGNSRMSGSGSAVFARAGTGDRPLATWDSDDLPPHWIGRMCRSLTAHPLLHWSG